ncbi:TonB-dependent siderophore receptor, partial [Nostoc sp.]|uniref:TonB-dependent siderophore receptor n=1 Tax=Nostoc sp. TaxID=1180 RepID=UPI002FF67F2D
MALPSIDLSGPLTSDKRLLYRFNASYQNFGSFIEFVNGENISISPVLSYEISNDTTLTFRYEYSRYNRIFYEGIPINYTGDRNIDNFILSELPISRNLGEPSDRVRGISHIANFRLEHRFNDNLTLKTAFGAAFLDGRTGAFRSFFLNPETLDASRFYRTVKESATNYSSQTDLIAKFNTGSVGHQLLLGLEYTYSFSDSLFRTSNTENPSLINIFNPIYGAPIPQTFPDGFGGPTSSNAVGVYLQDQVTLLSNLKLLIGGRYDFLSESSKSGFLTSQKKTFGLARFGMIQLIHCPNCSRG